MPNLLFSIFVLTTIIWVARRIFAPYMATLKYKGLKRFGVATYSSASVLAIFIKMILLFLSSEYLFFKGYYFYMSILGIIVVAIIIPILLFGFIVSISQNKNSFKMGPLTDEWKKNETDKLQKNIVIGILFRTIYTVAWFKTLNFTDISMAPETENIVVGILYAMTLYVLTYAILAGIKKSKENKLKKTN